MITEISVYLPNNPGVLAKFIKLLKNNDINIKAISVAETPDYGLLLILVDRSRECIELLKENNYELSATDVLAVKLEANPNYLFDLVDILGHNKINIEYLYMTVASGNTLIIIRVNDIYKAQDVLKKKDFTLIEEKEL